MLQRIEQPVLEGLDKAAGWLVENVIAFVAIILTRTHRIRLIPRHESKALLGFLPRFNSASNYVSKIIHRGVSECTC